MNNSTLQTPFRQLLSDAAARFGVAPADLAQFLAGEIRFVKDHPFNSTLTVYVAGHIVQLTPGEAAGCLTCTKAEEARRGVIPGSISKLAVCPASAAACVRYIIDRKWDKYGADFEAFRAGDLGNSEDLPAPLTTPQEIAADLRTEYPELAGRIDKALALVEAGATEFPQYSTAFDPATIHGNWNCDCPDAINREPRAKFGIACKHALAMEIARRVKVQENGVAYRELVSDLERERARGAL